MKKIIFLAVFSFFIRLSNAQTLKPDIISTTGGYYSNAAGSLSWTLGEPVIDAYADNSNILTEGFQQSSYSITATGSIDQPKVMISVYPNPFISTFNVKNNLNLPVHAEIVDISGKVIYFGTIPTGESQINLGRISDALYLLRVYDDKEHSLQTFKIQKVK